MIFILLLSRFLPEIVKLYSGERTVNRAKRTVNCALDIVNRMMSYILYLCLPWSYEVGSCNIVISVRWQLSNDIYLVIDYILTRYR